ncbi:L-arabinose transport system substrate-binding protein [Streptomyces sp. 846.5]|nr:substrate-binding domain-containing protein [Streptomyces sp. 846.5]TDT97462.1 L-arabinose transport system substrate-binding protein [Streptomyces sp. 846.5]
MSIGAFGMAAVLALAGCSTGQTTPGSSASGTAAGPKSGPITIAYLQKQGDQQYFIDEANGAKAEAAKLGNVKIVTVNLGTDSNKAISDMSTEVGQKVDGIAIVVPDQKIGPQIIQAAGAIPLVSSDDPISDGSGTAAPFVGFDSVQMGTKVGTKAGELFKASGWTAANTRVIAAYQQGLSDCQQREQGEEQGFSTAAGTSLPIIKVGTDNSVVDAQNKTGAVITANQGVKHWVVWGCNDENETGAVTALQNGGFAPADIVGVGLGAYLTCKDWTAKKDSGNKAALFIDGRSVGAAAVDALVAKIRNGTPLPPKTIAKTSLVDATSFAQAGVQCS